ncbi:MAG: heat-inducible transcriptional repressor HrcA, partial [Actinomycetales bacterium]|nr:heat-inducible transcriptional repressor HrcA [Actinomycetales bacterium]
RLLVVLITSSGRVEQRTIEVGVRPDPVGLSDLKGKLIVACVGQLLPEAVERASLIVADSKPADRVLVSAVVNVIRETFDHSRTDHRIAIAGTSNLARLGTDFDSTIRPVLEAIEEQVVLLKLIGDVASSSQAHVVIGHETGHAGLASTSIVTRNYGPGDEALATLGTVGPTRMDYPATMAAVNAVARYVGHTLADG